MSLRPSKLRIRQYQPPVIRIVDRVHLPRRIDLAFMPLELRRLVIDLIMHLRQKGRRGCSEPPPAA